MAKIKLLIFDLDGTLFDTAPGIHATVNRLLANMGREQLSYETVKTYIGHGLPPLVQKIAPEIHDDPVAMKQLVGEFRELYKEVFLAQSTLFDGVTQALSQWQHDLAIVSNKAEYFVKALVDNSSLKDFTWSEVFGGDSLSQMKPHPMPLLEVLESSQVKPENAIMIGDSRADIGAANAAGVKSLAVTFGYTPFADLLNEGADGFIHHYGQLHTTLDCLQKI